MKRKQHMYNNWRMDLKIDTLVTNTGGFQMFNICDKGLRCS